MGATPDSDDEWLPGHLSALWSARAGHVMTAGSSFTVGGRSQRMRGGPDDEPMVVRSPARVIFPENPFITSAVMARRDVPLGVGNFDPKLRLSEDLDTRLRLLERGTGLVLPQMTWLYHVHEARTNPGAGVWANAERAIYARYPGRSWLSATVIRQWAIRLAWDELQAARARHDWPDVRKKLAWSAPNPLCGLALAQSWRYRRLVRHRSASVAMPGAGINLASAGQPAPMLSPNEMRPHMVRGTRGRTEGP